MKRGVAPPAIDTIDEGVLTSGHAPSETALRAAQELEPLRTEYPFVLPRGYVDRSGTVHRRGIMRLATARDELLPLIDERVRENEHYLTVVLLARVITKLGDLDEVHAGMVENLFASDLAFLQDLYRRINTEGTTRAGVVCPACKHDFTVDIAGGRLGEPGAPGGW